MNKSPKLHHPQTKIDNLKKYKIDQSMVIDIQGHTWIDDVGKIHFSFESEDDAAEQLKQVVCDAIKKQLRKDKLISSVFDLSEDIDPVLKRIISRVSRDLKKGVEPSDRLKKGLQ